ncbi:unnamed protein product [Lepeophtheirus salmonis]|uniref:(salmon louse) hypothetical protein n=1 Tax=Lepeophtheirus salmonis TaxID=72036 RepID=A0A7R8D8X5_LEPSM|nr:unnamed protein product [Lepeophtheirus salmonis]CAF3039974.1 unnamed protein product [Lepeophtheirus salmonis]
MWKQDSAPAHKAKRTQEWLKSNAFTFVPFSSWPHSSPDLNRVIEENVCTNQSNYIFRVHGYKNLRREMRASTEEMDWQSKYRSSPDRIITPVCVLRNSIVGYTSERVCGNNWRHDFVPSSVRFSVATPRNPYLTRTFRYMGMHRSVDL